MLQREPFALVIAVMIKTFFDKGHCGAAFEQRPYQIVVVYSGIISDAFVKPANVEQALLAKKKEMLEVIRLLFKRAQRKIAGPRRSHGSQLVDAAVRKV